MTKRQNKEKIDSLFRVYDNRVGFTQRILKKRRSAMSDVLRTPEDRFQDLPGFPFEPNYREDLPGFEGMRAHYIDEGPRDAGHTFLCLHGQPTWSYLYRRMIPVFTRAGHRAVAPDLFGFGRSDKPAGEEIYTFDFHRDMLKRFIEQLDLRRITLVCQDWGGILGLTLPLEMQDRFSRLLVMNTALGTGDVPLSPGFLAWREWSGTQPDLACGRLLQRSCPHLTPGESAAYESPFPDAAYKSGVRRFPNLVPGHPDAQGAEISRRARDWFRKEWDGPAFMAIGMQDPVLGPPVMKALHREINGCGEPYEMEAAGHFVQEWGEDAAERAMDYFRQQEKGA
jgi:haloalkane dehalogenase